MKEPTVSVAMATYNGERFLQEQLDSLARQTLLPCELVACDDGSTDGTLDILHIFAAKAPFPVRIYRNETRLGYGFNFLGAVTRCAGELVAFCDQDDVWEERKLRVCAQALHDPGVAMVSHSARVFSSQPLSGRVRRPDHRSTVWRNCRDLPAHRWAALGFSIVLRRAVLERVPVPEYNAEVAPGCVHDVWATLAALGCGRVVLMSDELTHYRLHAANVSLRRSAAGLDRLAPDCPGLEQAARYAAAAEGFLRYAASFCDESARAVFYQYISRLDRNGRLYCDRAQLHRACGHRVAALITLARMLAKGDYGPGGLGVKAFARDAALAMLWPPPSPAGGGKLRCPDRASDMIRLPKASIIINNYNYGRFLPEAIESASGQSYSNLEVVVVDDGSIDNSREVIASYGERIIPVLKANGGQASAFNAGFAASKGDLILFLDSDDMLAPNAIATVVREWREGLARIYFPLCVVDASGNPTGKVMGGTASPDPMSGPFCGGSPTSGNVFSRAALDKIIPIPDEHWRVCADLYVNAASTLFGEVARIEQPLGMYRMHGRNNEVCAEEVASFRNRIRLDLRLYDGLFHLTDGRMTSLENWLGASPQHWVRRIKLLRERPGDYPWPDTFPWLTARGAMACWREPGRSFHHRLAYTIFVIVYGLLPKKAASGLRGILRTIEGSERGRTFRRLLGA